MSPTLTSISPPRSRDVISKLAKISFVFEKERKKRKKKSSESRNVWHWCRKNPRDFREWTGYTPENIKQTNVSCLLTSPSTLLHVHFLVFFFLPSYSRLVFSNIHNFFGFLSFARAVTRFLLIFFIEKLKKTVKREFIENVFLFSDGFCTRRRSL